MNELITYSEAREKLFRAVNDHPENIELLSHNAAYIMMKGIRWPEGFSNDKIGIAVEAFFIEFWRRWEFALGRPK